ncbi:xanthine dehydrogenase/oxidase-like [Anopheles aquasalis]|uniref:xanthine dehydrogenase/oxidase-like n=1 Tax=Anopheles aquasalis TaxID=42839 RepID=UPI00215ADA03|nr:xanthine dehydrogenase/oxidase-like [Anopheles aquasalis]
MLSSIGTYIWGSSSYESPLSEVTFTINGKAYTAQAATVPLTTSLSTFIRTTAHLTGTKTMCLEGGCGVCIVNMSGVHPFTKETRSWSVNSCLFPVFACHGFDIKTAEAIGNKTDGYHPTQERLAQKNGTQCGFCSPGMVMSMYSLMEAKRGSVTMEQVENALGGNICRCTGYRPILDAFKSLAVDADGAMVQDIEELQICPKTGSLCSGQCPVAAARIEPERPVQLVFADNQEWHKVFTVNDVFAIFDQIGSRPYMLVGGNTAHGVYRRDESLEVFIDINNVTELRSYYHTATELLIGANVNLSEFIEILTKAASNRPTYEYCRELAQHLDLVAHPAVRNVGSIAGNLSIKNQHPEFPSDVYLLLEAVGAKLSVAETRIRTTPMTAQEFVRRSLHKKVLKSISLPPIDPSASAFRSYKIMPRAQNCHAYVNAAFLVQFSDDRRTVHLATLCFGGIKPKFTHATETEQFLVGRKLFDDATLKETFEKLTGELEPDWVLPDASSEYRKQAAIALFYRYVLSLAQKHDVAINHRFASGASVLKRPLSSGVQKFETNEKNWPLTQNIPKLEGHAQASGEAKFTNDMPPIHGELHAAFVVATRANSKIGLIDPADALKLPGVVAFYSAKDIPGTNNFMSDAMIPFFPDVEEIFCSGMVLYHGQPVGVIVAERFDIANRAAKLVKIIYERVSNEPIYPTIKALLQNQPKQRIVDQPAASGRDTGSTVGVEVANTIRGRLELEGQYHFTMETQTCVCVPIEDGMDVHAATQWIDLCQVAIASMLKVPENSLNFTVRRLGSGYGSKLTRSSQIACACALAAHLTRRPVRFVMTLEANMGSIGKRYGCISNYQLDVDAKGKILRLTNNFMQDYGSNLNENIVDDAKKTFGLSYNSSSWVVEGKAVLTDSPANTWMRGPGTTEGMAMIETIMEHIAWETGVDPMDVRLLNMQESNELRQLLPEFRQDVGYDQRRKSVDDFNAANRWKKRGIAITTMQYPLFYFGGLHVVVSVYGKDGSVAITHGGIEVGQGINTKAAQVAAYTLGLPLKKIAMKPSSNLTSPNTVMTGASMTSEVVCFAVKRACEMLNERIKPIRDEFKDASWEKITQICYTRDIDLSAMYHYKSSELKPYTILGACCGEVEIDLLTGNIQLLRVDILEDTGESMSPGVDVGQIEGAFIMGVGYWLSEALVYDMSSGALLTTRTWNYKPPGAKDIPVDFRVRMVQTRDNQVGVLRSKATGEPALTMSIVVLFAMRYALRSAQKDAGRPDTWIPLGSATTPEQTFLKSFNSIDQYRLN